MNLAYKWAAPVVPYVTSPLLILTTFETPQTSIGAVNVNGKGGRRDELKRMLGSKPLDKAVVEFLRS